MKTRPILFSDPMVRAILDGRKTQTRRVVKPQPPRGSLWAQNYEIGVRCPFGQPGDRLWVREAFCVVDDREFGREQWVDYRATPLAGEPGPPAALRLVDVQAFGPGRWPRLRWRPSIYMPRWASRITLEVTGIRVERVQEISQADAWVEGVECDLCREDPRQTFIRLWDSINAKRGFGWDVNPWVWVVEFKVIP